MVQQPDEVAILERIRELESELVGQRGLLSHKNGLDGHRSIAALEVNVAGRPYLIPADPIREVVRMAKPQPLADAPDWVLGVIPYGSRTVPLIDLSMRLEGHATEVHPELFIVITEKPQWFGFVVHSVGRVIDLDPASLTSPGADVPCAPFLLGIEHGPTGETHSLLSVGRLGAQSELDD